ncbi:MAG: hypothetical protein WA324_12060 [Bryobacteraceae bacterium]
MLIAASPVGAVEFRPRTRAAALAEVVALRSLLLNLHFRTAKREPVPGVEMPVAEAAAGLPLRSRWRRDPAGRDHGGMGTQT